MRVLALDIGSSSVKCAMLVNGKVHSSARAAFATRYEQGRAEVSPVAILRAIGRAVADLRNSSGADLVALCAMAPSWIAMDRQGRPLTPVITHQDRRSVMIAVNLEKRVGAKRHLRLAGNRPFPGGISSTTAAWFAAHQPEIIGQADLAGHLSTFLVRRWTGARVIDPSNASFTGFYKTTTLGGWSSELIDAAGMRSSLMPEVIEASAVAGKLTRSAAKELGLTAGTPVLPGIMDTSAAVLLKGAKPGLLFNVSGSTDVLARCVDRPIPNERLLTRAVGVGRSWMAVSTLASAGTTLSWLKDTLFSELSEKDFYAAVMQAMRKPEIAEGIRFEPHLAGDRMSIEQRQGAFSGLTLATTRKQMLAAALDALARASGRRLEVLQSVYGPCSREVMVAGGVGLALAKVLHRDWPGKWKFNCEAEATLRGLYRLAESAVNR